MNVRSADLSALLLAAAISAPLGTAAREVQSLQPLLLDALRHGQAQGVLVGPMAETLAQLFRTTAPLRLSVQAVGEIAPGCRRLEVTATQDAVWDRNSTQALDRPEARRLVYRVTMCADGSFPEPAAPRPAR